METRLLFQTDAYLRSIEAEVVAINGSATALTATVFYPGGGGQPHDCGQLMAGGQTWRVLKVWREGAIVWHQVQTESPTVGTGIRAELDWDRRYALMRTHTALHILYPGPKPPGPVQRPAGRTYVVSGSRRFSHTAGISGAESATMPPTMAQVVSQSPIPFAVHQSASSKFSM